MTSLQSIIKYAVDNKIEIVENEPMKKHTTFKIGGPADIIVYPSKPEQITDIISLCKENETEYVIIGNGSNLLVSDKGIRGVVIKTDRICGINLLDEVTIEVYCGESLAKTAVFALNKGLSGLEFAQGIPGSVGGGVYMNAGAYDGEMSNIVIKTIYLDKDGKEQTVYGSEHGFSYRNSIFKENNYIIIKTYLKLKKGEPENIKEKMLDFKNRRAEKQPLEFPSAGSIFKRPTGFYAGKLIQDCGLKGYSIGGAQVSEKHTGFIINKGKATCDDVTKLIKYIQNKVFEKYGVKLETEVRFIGEK